MRRGMGFGFIVVVVGVLYLLMQMGILSFARTWMSGAVLWPLLIAAAGVYGLFQTKRRKIPWTSLFLIAFGVLLSLKGTHRFLWLNHIGFWGLLIALLIITAGLSLMFHGGGRFGPIVQIQWDHDDKQSQQGDNAEMVNVAELKARSKKRRTARTDWRLLGDISLGRSPWVLRDMSLWNGLGDVRVNLATAHIEEDTYYIHISGWLGSVRVLVPEDLPVCVDAHVSLGNIVVFGDKHAGTGRSSQFEDPAFASAKRRCYVTIESHLGDVEVVRV